MLYLSKPIENTSRVNPKVNYALWVIMMCQCRLNHCNKCPILLSDADNPGGHACGGLEYMGTLCTCISIF